MAVQQQGGGDARHLLVQQVKDDIRQVLSQSWELEAVLQAAPKAKAATIQRLSRPRNTRSPTGTCEYADYKAAQLGKQRAAQEQRQREEAAYEVARQEALQGWLRAKEQEQHRAAIQYQQQLQEAEEVARASAGAVTRAAMSNLAALKQQLEQQKQQAALAGQQATPQQRRQALLQHASGGAADTQHGCCQHVPVQPVVSYIKDYISTGSPGR